MVGADVITARHHTLHDEGKTHGVEHAGVLWDSVFSVHSWVFLYQLSVQEFSSPHEDHEETSKHHIANVGEDMVEVGKGTKGVCTQEVVVAQIFIACRTRVEI